MRQLLRRVKNHTYNRLKGCRHFYLSQDAKRHAYKAPMLFTQKYLEITEPLFTTNSLKAKVKELHVNSFIVGSDQVWRPSYNPNISNYYLDFLKGCNGIKKVAYAASFGVDEWEYGKGQTKKFRALAQLFNQVSVREKSGVDLCRTFLNVQARQVVDPTMLLSKEDYLKVIDCASVPQRQGIFTYLLDDSIEKSRLTAQVEQALHLKVFNNQPRAFEGSSSRNLDDYVVPPVEGWIKAFDQAAFVITDSFHGTVFSIIFNKPFLAVVNKQKGASRFHSLLDLLGLQDRLVDEDCIFDINLLNQGVDYNAVNAKLDRLRSEGVMFLEHTVV